MREGEGKGKWMTMERKKKNHVSPFYVQDMPSASTYTESKIHHDNSRVLYGDQISYMEIKFCKKLIQVHGQIRCISTTPTTKELDVL